MTNTDTHEPEFYMAPVIADSAGRSVVPNNAIARGSLSAVVGNIIDSQERKACEAVINDAAKALDTLKNIRAREDAVKKREDAVNAKRRTQLLHDFSRKLDALANRLDQLEQERAAADHDPDDDLLTSPPGSPGPLPSGDDDQPVSATGDDGELAAVPVPEIEKYQPGPRNPVAAEDA